MAATPKAKAPAKRRGSPRPNAGRKRIEVGADKRREVEIYASLGIPHTLIAELVGLTQKTLTARCPDELAHGKTTINARIAKTLAMKALDGDNASMFFWLKTQARWQEVTRHEHTGAGGGPIATVDLSSLTPEERAAMAPVIDKLIAAATGEQDDAASGEAL